MCKNLTYLKDLSDNEIQDGNYYHVLKTNGKRLEDVIISEKEAYLAVQINEIKCVSKNEVQIRRSHTQKRFLDLLKEDKESEILRENL